MSFNIGSFNLCNFNYESEGEEKKAFNKIASIIKQENFDIIALQEVLSKSALDHLLTKYLSKILKDWRCKWLQPHKKYGGDHGDKRGEGYAYIWNANKVDLVQTENENGFIRVAEPVIWSQYSKKNGSIEREPYYARFTPNGKIGGCFCEIRLINTHIIWGSNQAERLQEYNKLLENVYVNIANRRYGNNMPAYTIMLGDYNLTTRTLEKNGGIIMEKVFLTEDRDAKMARSIITVQNEPTTISSHKNEDGELVSDGYTMNDYDHFSFTQDLKEKTQIRVGRVDAVRKYYGTDTEAFTEYRKKISDHVPIKMQMDLKKQ